MVEVRQTAVFARWLGSLRDRTSAARIAQRIVRLQAGLATDVKPVGGGVLELRIHHGPGFRLYFVRRGTALVVLLCGGDKSTQRADIAQAIRLAEGLP